MAVNSYIMQRKNGNEFDNCRVVPAKKLPIDLDVQLLVGGEIRRIQISYLLWIG